MEETEGSVHGIYKNAVYFRMPADRLIMLHDSALGALPFGIAVNQAPDFQAFLGPIAGEPIQFRKKRIEIAVVPATVFLDDVQIWEAPAATITSSALARARINLDFAIEYGNGKVSSQAGCCALAAHVEDLFVPSKRTNENMNLFYKRLFNPLHNLIQAFGQKDFFMIDNSLDQLIGLGDGLTPAMDDVLTGMITTLHYFKTHLVCGADHVDVFAQSIKEKCRGRTTLVSEAFLWHAAAGYRFNIVDEILQAVLHQESDQLGRKIDQLLSFGHSSGAMIFLGLTLGLKLALDRVGVADSYC